jgi:phosphoglycerate dehydrogenase-like enzyme
LLVLAGDSYTTQFVEAVLRIPAVRWAHTEDAGTDGLFYDAMRARGVTVTHSPGTNAIEVAEFAFGQILWSAKRFGTFRDNQRAHKWQLLGLESLSDKTLLIIGLGAIGREVAKFAKSFGMRVLGIRQSPTVTANTDQQGTLADLRQMLPVADFVVLAVPLTQHTRALLGKDELALMKPTATLINVARGAVVDVPALKDALQSGRLRQACLDVLPTEPWPADDELWDIPNLFLTPHNAWSSPMYLPRVADLWLENLRRYVQGEELLHRVR